MIIFQTKISLKKLNTFSIDVKAVVYTVVESVSDVHSLFKNNNADMPILVLGGGSNILFTKNYEGIVIKNNIQGIEKIEETAEYILIEVGGGVIWDDFVSYAVRKNYFGIENLSYIPGTIGASPVQNIGAYGMEVKDTIYSVKYFDIKEKVEKEILNIDCKFDYRKSIFKEDFKNKTIITSVIFKLNKNGKLNLSYQGIKDEIGDNETTLENVRKAVISIRKKKLPEPAEIGNAGSFFKNPLISEKLANELKNNFHDIPLYPDKHGYIKTSAAYLIDKCVWKGYREGDAGVHDKQPLILVNYGNATGQEIVNLSEKIKKSVFEKFGVLLDTEVNVL